MSESVANEAVPNEVPVPSPIQLLASLVIENCERLQEATPNSVDVGFLHVDLSSTSKVTKELFQQTVRDALAHKEGWFTLIDADRMLEGPSYIELGAWIGDQGTALCLMGLGEKFELWKVMGPQSLGVEGELAQQMLGAGFLMAVPTADSPIQAWAAESKAV